MKNACAVLPALLLALSPLFAATTPTQTAPAVSSPRPVANPVSFAQRRDPLTENEADQIRELSDQPDKRLKLFVKFITARMDTIEQMEGDPRMAAGRGQRIHDLLQDITSLVDELDDNVDDYVDKKLDIRKGLKDVIEADTSLQLKLRTLKDQVENTKEYADYNFELQDATDAVNGSLDDARESLQDLQKILKEEKKKK